MKYAIGSKVFDLRIGKNFLVVDAELVDEVATYTLKGEGTSFEQLEEFLVPAKKGRSHGSTVVEKTTRRLAKSLKINSTNLGSPYIRELSNSEDGGRRYEILPTPEEIIELEKRRSAPVRTTKPKSIQYYTIANAPKDVVTAALHKVLIKK